MYEYEKIYDKKEFLVEVSCNKPKFPTQLFDIEPKEKENDVDGIHSYANFYFNNIKEATRFAFRINQGKVGLSLKARLFKAKVKVDIDWILQ